LGLVAKPLAPFAKRALPTFTKVGRRALRIKKLREKAPTKVMETLDEYVARVGGPSKRVAQKAFDEGFPIETPTVKALRAGVRESKAAKRAGQSGVQRIQETAPGDLRETVRAQVQEKFGFVPAEKQAVSPPPLISQHGHRVTPLKALRPVAKKHVPLATDKPVSGTFFHGTKAPISSIADADPMYFGDVRGLFGPGLYLTDDISIAAGYARTKGKGQMGRILTAKVKDVNLLDLEQKLPDDVLGVFESVIGKPVKARNAPGGNVIKELQEFIHNENFPKEEAVEIFQELYGKLRERGFEGFKYAGGGRIMPGSKKHNVLVLFPDDWYAEKGVAKPTGRLLRDMVESAPKAVIEGERVLPAGAAPRLVKAGPERLTPSLQRTVQETAEQVQKEIGTGVGPLGEVAIPEPTQLGGAATRKLVENINTRQVVGPDELAGAFQQIGEANAQLLGKAGRRPMTMAEIKASAEARGLMPDKAMVREIGEAWKSPETYRVVQEATDLQMNKAWSLAQKINPKDPKQIDDYVREMTRAAGYVASERGGISETARILGMANRIRGPEQLRRKAVRDLFKYMRTQKDWAKAAEKMATIDPNDTAALNAFIQNLQKGTWTRLQDGLFYVWINSILSGFRTQVRNIAGNTITAMMAPVERLGAATISAARPLIGKQRERFFGEALQGAVGLGSGLKEGTRGFFKALASGNTQFGGGTKFGVGGEIGKLPPIPGKLGTALGLPGRFLVAFDDFFKMVNYQSAMYAGAYRRAAKEGLKGQALTSKMSELITKPTGGLVKEAFDEAVYRTFTKELGPWGKSLQNLTRNIPGLRYVVPFLRTPVNIFKFGLERTPLNYLRIARKMASKTDRLSGGALDDALARATIGTLGLTGAGFGGVKSIIDVASGKVSKPAEQARQEKDLLTVMGMLASGGVAQLFAEGAITGGAPIDDQERKAWYASGRIPYGFKVGGQWYQYNLEPFGTSIGAMVDMLQVWDELEEEDAAVAMGFAMAKNFVDKQFMQGMSNFMDAWSDPQRDAGKFARNLAAGAIPYSNLIKSLATAGDPTLRFPRTVTEAFKQTIPKYREEIPPIYDIWGKEVKFEGSMLERLVSPLRRSTESKDLATQEVVRLRAKPGSIRKAIGQFEVTDPIYGQAQQLRGQRAHERITKLVQSKRYQKMTDIEKAENIEREFTNAGMYARNKLGITAASGKAQRALRKQKIEEQRGRPERQQREERKIEDLLRGGILQRRNR
jgi:hypothetical protein